MADPLTPKNFQEYEYARKPRKSPDANLAQNAVLAELALRAVPRVRELAKTLLFFVITDVLHKNVGEPASDFYWTEGGEFALWKAMQEGPQVLTQREVDDLKALADEAGGWWWVETPGETSPQFLSLQEWTPRYKEWLQATTRKL